MGLSALSDSGSGTLVHPATGKPVRSDDPSFLAISNELADKGMAEEPERSGSA